MADLSNLGAKQKITIAGAIAGLYYILTDPVILSYIPTPYDMIISKFILGATGGGILFHMNSKPSEPKA